MKIAQTERVDVVLIDITLAGESGFELARQLSAPDKGAAALILISTHSRADFADLIAESPAAGFLPKSELSADAIRRIASGNGSGGGPRRPTHPTWCSESPEPRRGARNPRARGD